MPPPPGPERRKHPRVAKRVMLKFRCLAPDLMRDRAEQVGIILEISRGGLILKSPRTYLPGAILELKMPQNELGPARTLHMKVVWQRRAENLMFDLGGAFVRVTAAPEGGPATPTPGGTRRFEKSTLGVSTGDTVRRVRSTAPAGQPERRAHARWAEKIYLKYRCTSKGLFFEPEARVGLMLDFSRGGFVFAGLREYTAGSVMEVKFPATPLGPGQTLFAKVVRASPHEKPGQYRIGCVFVQEQKSATSSS